MHLRLASAAICSIAMVSSVVAQPGSNSGSLVGAVYAMSNNFDQNSIVAYGRASNGLLTPIGEFLTGGQGAAFDGGEGLDPLISAYSVLLSEDRRFLLAVNAGSNTITAFRIRNDFSLRKTDQKSTGGVGPNSIAYSKGLVYVSNIDADGFFNAEPDQEGSLMGYRLSRRGKLTPIRHSTELLGNRPSAIQFSPDGRFLLVASINAGSAGLASGSSDEIVSYRVGATGRLQRADAVTSTLPNNEENRNLPSAIGIEVVRQSGEQYVVATEAREFQADGTPPAFPALQSGSVSTWRLDRSGTLSPVSLDVLAGRDLFDGQRTTCWIEFSADGNLFWVSNALEATLSSYTFDRGQINLLNEIEAAGIPASDADPFGTTDGWIDLWLSQDGRYLYQLFGLDGTIGVYAVEGSSLTLIQEVSNLPQVNTQGIVAF